MTKTTQTLFSCFGLTKVFFLYASLIFFSSLFLNPKWCRSGVCVLKTASFEKYTALAKPVVSDTSEKSNLIDDRKYGNLMKSDHSINRPTLVNSVEEVADEIDALKEVSCKLSKFYPPKNKHLQTTFMFHFLDFFSGACLFESSDFDQT